METEGEERSIRSTDRGYLVWELTAEKGTEREVELRRRSRTACEWLPIAHYGPKLMHALGWGLADYPVPAGAQVAAYGDTINPHHFYAEEVEALRAKQRGDGSVLFDIDAVRLNGEVELVRENLHLAGVVAYAIALRRIQAVAEFRETVAAEERDVAAVWGEQLRMLTAAGEQVQFEIACGLTQSLIIRRSDKTEPPPRESTEPSEKV